MMVPGKSANPPKSLGTNFASSVYTLLLQISFLPSCCQITASVIAGLNGEAGKTHRLILPNSKRKQHQCDL